MIKLIATFIGIILTLGIIGSGCKKNSDSGPTGTDAGPQITGISPERGSIGTVVTITGTDFSANTSEISVAFNGTRSDVISSTKSRIETTVPENATSGIVTVTSSGITLNGPAFTVEEPDPEISSITPDTAFVGDEITIRGNNFGEDSSAVLVLISNITVNIVQFSDSLIIAETVDPEGDTGTIEVEVVVNNISSDVYDDFNILRIRSVATGEFHSCAITIEGNPYCWGNNESGQLGNSTFNNSVYPVAVEVPQGIRFSSITASRYHTLAIDESGQVWGWGRNSSGNLGDGSTIDQNVPVKASVPAGIMITKISTGIAHTLALDESGQIWSWGNNNAGRLGDGTEIDRASPELISNPQNIVFTDLDAGIFHSLALDEDGQVWGWGNNADGKLGDGTTTNRIEPTRIIMPNGVTFTRVSGGTDHSIAMTLSGGVWAWGSNEEAQLGSGTLSFSSTPVQVDLPAGLQINEIEAGGFHNLATTSTGELWGWGSSASGRLGAGFTTATVSQPVMLESPSEAGFYAFSADRNHSLAISLNGAIPYAWGRNGDGQLGDGSSQSQRSNIRKVIFDRQ